MKTIFWILPLAAVGALSTGCTTVALAPGADQVRITHNAADVASCKAVGNVDVPPDTPTPTPDNLERQLRNLTVGLGGNAVFVTVSQGIVLQGVAYRCP